MKTFLYLIFIVFFNSHEPDSAKQKMNDQMNQQKIFEQNQKLNNISDTVKKVDDKLDIIIKQIQENKRREKELNPNG